MHGRKGAQERLRALAQRNIPGSYRSLDLRLFFSDWIERGKFKVFHFLHRPEVLTSSATTTTATDGAAHQDTTPAAGSSTSPSSSSSSSSSSRVTTKETRAKAKEKEQNTCCCVVELYSERDFAEFKRRYHRRHWTDRAGGFIPLMCLIRRVKLPAADADTSTTASERNTGEQDAAAAGADEAATLMGMPMKSGTRYLTRRQRVETARAKSRESEKRSLAHMPELQPPKALLPQGNVGTPLKWIQERVQECAFPSSLIKKLGIHALRRRKAYRRYGEVHFDYSSYHREEDEEDDDATEGRWEYAFDEAAEARSSKPAAAVQYHLHKRKRDHDEGWPDDPYGGRDSEGEQDAEEWERHEALQHEEHEEYLYEGEIELQWEKGGSGLVFLTDGVYWNDEEAKDADHFDLDTAHYYDRVGGDDDNLYGASQNQYTPEEKEKRKASTAVVPASSGPYGAFERHTTGFGSRILRQYGWTEGSGVGRTPGQAEAVELRTQLDTTGLGFGPDHDAGGKRKRRRKSAAPPPRRTRDIDEDDQEEGGPDARSAAQYVLMRPGSGAGGAGTAALVQAEHMRRWRMANDPSYVTINTVYDHPRTNPLQPLVCYDDDDDDAEREAQADQKTRQAEVEDKAKTAAAVWRLYAFPTKPFVRGGTMAEACADLKQAEAHNDTEPSSQE